MRNISLFILLTVFLSYNSKAQTTKGNWMLGGKANFTSTKIEGIGETASGATFTNLQAEPNVGYFFADKLAGGISGVFDRDSYKPGGIGRTVSLTYGFGPYIRYYFLPIEDQLNFFSQGTFMHVFNQAEPDHNIYSLTAGSVVFLTTNVGLEFSGTYSYYKNANQKNNTILVGLGFQIHLERE
jgi:hypothetical protein